MRFAMVASDRNYGVMLALLERGWTLKKLFTTPADNISDFNMFVVSKASSLGVPVQLSRIVNEDLAILGLQGCDGIVCAGYNWRIPDWRPHLSFGINFHPSPLPYGRGPQPVVRAILENWGEWAVTCHQLTADFDQGDILAAEEFVVDEDETYDSLDLKVQIASRRLSFRVAGSFADSWEHALAQSAGTYWPNWTDNDRTISFDDSVSKILRQIRAFGSLETIAELHGSQIVVRRAFGWRERHSHAPGALIHMHHHHRVVAAADGFIALTEWRPLQTAYTAEPRRMTS